MEDYDLPDNDAVNFTLESYEQPDNDEVDFTPREEEPEEEGTPEPFDIGVDAADIPLSLNLPMRPLNIGTMEMGIAVFLVGINALLLGAGAWLRNYAALVMWGFALFALIASGLFQIGLELYWTLVAATILTLMIGAVVRWTT